VTLPQRLDELEALYGELRQERAGVEHIKLREKYDRDPVGFIRDVLHGDPWPIHEEIAAAVRDYPQVAVQSCHGAGKDWLAARLAVWGATMGWTVLITGPTERQVKQTLMDDVFSAWQGATPALGGELRELGWRIARGDKSGIVAFTSTDVSRITGLRGPKTFAIITEAQDEKLAHAYEGIRACLTGDVTRFLLLGNPYFAEGEFYKACTSSRWKTFKLSAFDLPSVKTPDRRYGAAITTKWIADAAADFGGEFTAKYRTKVLGEFPEGASEDSLYPPELRAAAYARHVAAAAESEDIALGVDVGGGTDESAVAVRIGSQVTEIVTWNERDTMVTTGKVRVVAERVGIRPARGGVRARGTLIVDVNGLGQGVGDRLREAGFNVTHFKAQGKAPEPKNRHAIEFGNLRSASFWRLKVLMEAGLGLPRDVKLDAELAVTRYDTGSSGRIYVKPKKEIKEKLGRSPDRADAVALACWKVETISWLGAQGQW